MVIDSHHHFWNYDPVEFDWIDESMRSIRRSFLPDDLEAQISTVGIDGVISVQARQILKETDFLLNQAEANEFIKAVVGWVPLADANINELLDRYNHAPKLKSVRHVVQGEARGFLDSEAFNHGINALKAYDLVYDILIFEHQLAETIRFVDRHPNQAFVLNHIAKPQIKINQFEPWKENILELSKRENVTCKISGMVTEADFHNWQAAQLHPYLDTVLEAFGADRIMFGSDWPVCLVACDYKQWYDLIREYIQQLSSTEQANIMGNTAIQTYKI